MGQQNNRFVATSSTTASPNGRPAGRTAGTSWPVPRIHLPRPCNSPSRRTRLAWAAAAALVGLPGLIRSAGAQVTYTYTGQTGTTATPATGNFTNGFDNGSGTPVSPDQANAAIGDALLFGGSSNYTATDDLANPVTSNGVRFDNTGAVIVARGTTGASNTLVLDGSNPFLNFNNSGTLSLNLNVTVNPNANAYIVKSTGTNPGLAAASNPVLTGGTLNLGDGSTTTVALADSPGDSLAELTLGHTITGTGTLTFQNNATGLPGGVASMSNQADWGTTLLSGNNAGFSGAVNINFGRVVANNSNAFGTGTLTIGNADSTNNNSGGTLALGGNNTGGAAAYGAVPGGGNLTIANPVNLGGATGGDYAQGIQNNGGNNTLSGPITLTQTSVKVQVNNGTTLTFSNTVTPATDPNSTTNAPLNVSLNVSGNGTLILSNTVSLFNLFPHSGAVTIANGGSVTTSGWSSIGQNGGDNAAVTVQSGGSFTVNGDFNVSDLNGSNGVVTVQSGGVASGNTLYVGKGGNATGILNLSGTALFQGTPSAGGEWRIGGGGGTGDAASVGVVNMSGGTLSTYNGTSAASGTSRSANFQVGGFGKGLLNQTGGTVISSGWTDAGRFGGSYGVIDVSGGSFVQTATDRRLFSGEDGSGVITARGGGAVTSYGGVVIGNTASGTGIVNVNTGGTLTAAFVTSSGGGPNLLNFNGGTLKPTAANNNFINNLTAATVYSGGAVIDTTNGSLTISQPLVAPAGNGVSAIAVTGGTGFKAPPVVQISGGGGTGASAVATIDANGNLTGFTVTSPGTGYTSAPTVSLYAALGGTATSVTASIAANATTGGLTKAGTNTLTLSAANTYAGGTTITGGTLAGTVDGVFGPGKVTVASGGTLTESGGATNNYIGDTATLSLVTGALANLNYTGTDTIGGLVLNGTTKSSGVYGAIGNPSVLAANQSALFGTYNASTGTDTGTVTVTATPEPASLALLALGAGGLLARRRRPMRLA